MFTSNPDLPKRLFKGRPLAKYHRPTFYTSGEKGYLGWPRWEEQAKAVSDEILRVCSWKDRDILDLDLVSAKYIGSIIYSFIA